MPESKHTLADLHQMQSLPLSAKIRMTKQRIKWWVDEFGEDGVYVSFSGGKDSTVLLHMAREEYPNLKACFSNTGIEFQEIVQFVKTFTNVDIIKPKMTFMETVKKYGYPLISKEVSECVYGARKYLTALEAEMDAVDRQTDRQTDRGVCSQMALPEIPTAYRTRRIRYRFEFEKLTATGRYFRTPESAEIRGGVCKQVA